MRDRTVSELCEIYREQGFHCSESVIRACNDALRMNLSRDVLRSACGFRGGGGGAGGRCGVIEAGIILLSYQYGRENPNTSCEEYSIRIRNLIKEFHHRFGSTECREISPAEIKRFGNCGRIFRQGAELILQCLEDNGEQTAQI